MITIINIKQPGANSAELISSWGSLMLDRNGHQFFSWGHLSSRSSFIEIVFQWCCLTLLSYWSHLLLTLSSIEVVYHHGSFTLRWCSIEVNFHWSWLSLRSSSIEDVFHCGLLLLKLSSIEVLFHWDLLSLRSYSFEFKFLEDNLNGRQPH